MKTIISAGDLIDVYYKLRTSGFSNLLSRIIPASKENKVKKAWDSTFTGSQTSWWLVPLVQQRWNLLITGDSNSDYAEYVVQKYLSGRFNLKLLSPGCGTGNKELKFARFKNFSSVEAFDVSPKRIKVARQTVSESGYKNVNFTISDALKFNYGSGNYDVIVFDSFLHHVQNLDEILDKVKYSLKPDGLLLINEYVGPNRFQFPGEQIIAANEIFSKIPADKRKRWKSDKIKSRIYKPGLLRMVLSDPSEAVNSERILVKVRDRFKTLEEKPYGGNILQLVLKDISHNFINESRESTELLQYLFNAEDEYLKTVDKSDFIFGVYSI